MTDRDKDHTSGHICLCDFSPDEREVLMLIAQRISKARPQYGPLVIDGDPRDFHYEALLEDVDSVVYRSVDAIRKRRRGTRGTTGNPPR